MLQMSRMTNDFLNLTLINLNLRLIMKEVLMIFKYKQIDDDDTPSLEIIIEKTKRQEL